MMIREYFISNTNQWYAQENDFDPRKKSLLDSSSVCRHAFYSRTRLWVQLFQNLNSRMKPYLLGNLETSLWTWKHKLCYITLILEKSPSTWKQVKIQMILSFQASSDVSMLIVMFLKLIFVSKLITVFPIKQMIISYWFASKWKHFRKISRFRNNKKVRVIRTQLFSIDRD